MSEQSSFCFHSVLISLDAVAASVAYFFSSDLKNEVDHPDRMKFLTRIGSDPLLE
jgi:hypothetical protein